MAPVKISRVISVTSEDPRYPAKNLLRTEVAGCWKCKDPGEKLAAVILELEKSCIIQDIDIGNENSAFVEIFVGKSVSPDEFEMLRVTSVLMSVQDAKNGKNKNTVRFFKKEEFSKPAVDKSWDRVKIVCTQPFSKHTQYGLTFVKIHAKSENEKKNDNSILGKFVLKNNDSENDTIPVGSFFAKRKNVEPSTAASAIRAASNDPGSSILGKVAAAKRLSDVLLNKDAKKARKNGDASEGNNSDDCRRIAAGRLLYTDDELEADIQEKDDKKKKDSPKKTPKQKDPKPTTPVTKKPLNQPRKTPETPKPKMRRTPEPNTKKRANDEPSTSNKKPNNDIQRPRRKPFNKLLEGVVFVISGYQNPYRSELRSKALKMGAKYKADWESSCTHLICAFSNTPKHNQVFGLGWIVRKEWIEDCYSQKKRLLCSGYKIDKNDPYTNTNDEEIWEGEEKGPSKEVKEPLAPKIPINSNGFRSKSPENSGQIDIYEIDTDIDSEHEDPKLDTKYENISLKVLPEIFEDKTFYLGTDLTEPVEKMLQRYIMAYKGEIIDDVNSVTYIISGNTKYKNNKTKVPVILPDWVWDCNDSKKLIAVDEYLL